MHALSAGHRGVAAHLMSAGADASLRNAAGQSAADMISTLVGQPQPL